MSEYQVEGAGTKTLRYATLRRPLRSLRLTARLLAGRLAAAQRCGSWRRLAAAGGKGPGPSPPLMRGAPGPFRSACPSVPPNIRGVLASRPCRPGFFAPLRVLPLRGPFPPARPLRGRLARPRCRGARPAFPPSLRSRAPGPGRSPRLSRSACVRRCAAPWRSLAPSALRPAFLRCGLPVGSPFLRAALPGCSAWPRRVPPWPSPSGLRARGLRRRGFCRPVGRLFFAPPRRPFSSRLAPLRFGLRSAAACCGCWRCLGFAGAGWLVAGGALSLTQARLFLPRAPPPRRPRWGLRGARG